MSSLTRVSNRSKSIMSFRVGLVGSLPYFAVAPAKTGQPNGTSLFLRRIFHLRAATQPRELATQHVLNEISERNPRFVIWVSESYKTLTFVGPLGVVQSLRLVRRKSMPTSFLLCAGAGFALEIG